MRRLVIDDSPQKRRLPNLTALSLILWLTTVITLSFSRQHTSWFQFDTCHEKNSSLRIRYEEPETDPFTPFPRVAWLMSWPNSGTSYTLRMIRQVTNLTTATNYGHEHLLNDSSILVHQDWVNGPFRANLSQDLPEHYILTKTHCGSRCVHCAPDGYLETPRTFQRSCQSGRRHYNANRSHEAIYESHIVSRAIHLIRNPLDNVVSRFHLSRHHAGDRAYDNNVTGFQAWCAKMDTAYELYESHTPWLDPPLLELWKSVPCHAEFFKYGQWHNLAWITAESMDIPMHLLRYEDYDHNWKGTIMALLTFLELPATSWEDVTTFEMHTYESYYSSEQKDAIEALLRNVASAPIWEMVGTYFHHKEL